MIARHDAARGRADADRAKDGLAAQIAQAHAGDIIGFCRRVKAAIPSAKPCRMAKTAFPEGMRDSHVRTQLRAGDIAGWGWDRLCGAAAALDHEVVVTLRPRVRPDAGPTCA
jgi:hypothetical protein